jgi:hypothetical protein
VAAWCAGRRRPVGAVLTLAQGWALALAWFSDPRQAGWQRRPLASLTALVREHGLAGPFWALPATSAAEYDGEVVR